MLYIMLNLSDLSILSSLLYCQFIFYESIEKQKGSSANTEEPFLISIPFYTSKQLPPTNSRNSEFFGISSLGTATK